MNDYPAHRKKRATPPGVLLNPGRPPRDDSNDDPRDYDIDPPDELPLPKPLLVRATGSITLPDWDAEGHTVKDEVIRLLAQLSNRPRENGTRSGEYIALECQVLPDNDTKVVHQYFRRRGWQRWSLHDLCDLIRANQGSTVRDLTLKMFSDSSNPPSLEPRVRSMLNRIKVKGLGESRYDDRGVQRWYAPDGTGIPGDWDSRQRAIGHLMVSLWGGLPRDYAKLVDGMTALLDEQGERVIDRSAWITQHERPF